MCKDCPDAHGDEESSQTRDAASDPSATPPALKARVKGQSNPNPGVWTRAVFQGTPRKHKGKK